MRSTIYKYWALYLVGIIVQVIVVITVLIQTFRFTNSLAQALFNIISGWKVALNTFSFIADWAAAFSAFAVCLILIALFADFRKYRRNRALNRLHNWAKNAVLTLADYRKRDPALQNLPLKRYKEIKAIIDNLKANCRSALSDAKLLGGELDDNTKKTVHTLLAVYEKIVKQDDSAFEDLRSLQHNLADVMISTFESLKNARHTWLFVPRK